ncbi:MAG TPA: c-type cytochrome, partial [Vicinamibacterales bacterium]|nr:c-type cytochrome [Vicinamibacterales bacterium]
MRRDRQAARRLTAAGALLIATFAWRQDSTRAASQTPASPPTGAQIGTVAERRGAQLYAEACAACHGADGRGTDPASISLPVPTPDFTDCSFATREPDADWIAIAHEGGPV